MSGAGARWRSAGRRPGGDKAANCYLPAAQSDGPGFLGFNHGSPGGPFLSQVKKYLTFKAYTRPHYLSLGMMEELRIPDEGDIHRSDLEDLQHLDPLRRAFALAEEAENITTKGGDLTIYKASIALTVYHCRKGDDRVELCKHRGGPGHLHAEHPHSVRQHGRS